MRVIAAFLVAPVVPALVAWLLSPIPVVAKSAPWNSLLFLCVFYGYPVMLLVGTPAYVYFRRKNWLHLWQVVGVGAVAGSLIPLLLFGVLAASKVAEQGLFNALAFAAGPSRQPFVLGICLGIMSSLAFWVVALATAPSEHTSHSQQSAA